MKEKRNRAHSVSFRCSLQFPCERENAQYLVALLIQVFLGPLSKAVTGAANAMLSLGSSNMPDARTRVFAITILRNIDRYCYAEDLSDVIYVRTAPKPEEPPRLDSLSRSLGIPGDPDPSPQPSSSYWSLNLRSETFRAAYNQDSVVQEAISATVIRPIRTMSS